MAEEASVGRQHRYRVGERVHCTVSGIYPFGVFVRLSDGTEGYIRLRELSLEGDERGLKECQVDRTMTAVVTELPERGKHYELSHRLALQDPWETFLATHTERDVVTGVVKTLSNADVMVEIEPGVRGHIPLREIATWDVAEPKDVLWTGDCVQATITRLQSNPPRMTLSIRRELEKSARITSLLDRLDQQSEPGEQADLVSAAERDLLPPLPYEPVQLPGPLLLVDDNDELRTELAQWLRGLGCIVEEASSGPEALARAPRGHYALVIADLDMPGLDGVTVISRLRTNGVKIPIAVMSDPAYIVENLHALLGLDIASALPKPFDKRDVHDLLKRLEAGERPRLDASTWAQPLKLQPIQATVKLLEADDPIAVRMEKVLERVVQDTGASHGAIFHLNPVSLQMEVTAFTPSIRIAPEAVYGLLESPVRDAIAEDRVLVEGHVMEDDVQARRFTKLLRLLPFESCMAVPLNAGGQVEHALFLFHRSPAMFHLYRQRDALAAATLLSALLENQALEKRMRDLSGLLLSGQLAAGFGHEVHNKLAILNLQFDNLRADLGEILAGDPELRDRGRAQALTAAANAAAAASAELQRTVRDFRKLMAQRQEELVNVNQVVRQAEELIRPIARRSQVAVKLELAAELPMVWGSGLGLQQVILNLLLNAVQHTAVKKHTVKSVTVQTRCAASQEDGRIEIRVIDTGPGIHHQLWDKVFELGFTTRGSEGSGLGLFIARSLLKPMSGHICIESSYVPLGTTFLVDLPVATA